MEKKILVYDDNGTESEEFRTMLAQLSSQFQGHGLRFKQIYNLKGGLDAWQETGFQTVKVNTRALTPPLPSFTTSSQPSAQLQTSTPVTTLTTSTSTSTPVVITSATTSASASASASSPPTPTASVPLSSSHSQTPGFETLPTVIGIFIGIVFMAGFFMARRKKERI